MTDEFGVTINLVHRAQNGDGEALDRLIGRYYERVRRIVRLRLGPRLRGRSGPAACGKRTPTPLGVEATIGRSSG